MSNELIVYKTVTYDAIIPVKIHRKKTAFN